MRQTHVGGDKLFVDYAGDTVPVIVDRLTGEVRQALQRVAEHYHQQAAGELRVVEQDGSAMRERARE
jgi:transposase